MDEGFTQKVCFCRVHGTFLSQTLPRQTTHHLKNDSPFPVRQTYERNQVIQNTIKGAFNNLGSESIEDLTNKFGRISHQDPNLTRQSVKSIIEHPEFCSYMHYDTVDQDIDINAIDPAYINNSTINTPFQSEYSGMNTTQAFPSPSFFQHSQENYYDPVNCVEGDVSRHVMPEGLYVRPNQNYCQLSTDTVPDIDNRSSNVKKDRHSKSKDRKLRKRRDVHHDVSFDEFYMGFSPPASSNSRSAPTSPAQNRSKPRRHRRENHSYKSKKVSRFYSIL